MMQSLYYIWRWKSQLEQGWLIMPAEDRGHEFTITLAWGIAL